MNSTSLAQSESYVCIFNITVLKSDLTEPYHVEIYNLRIDTKQITMKWMAMAAELSNKTIFF